MNNDCGERIWWRKQSVWVFGNAITIAIYTRQMMFGEPHVTNTMLHRLTGFFLSWKKEYFFIRVSIFRMQLLFEWRFAYCVVCAWICACFFVHSMSGWLWQVSSCAQIWLMGTAIAKENKNQCIAICKLRRKNNNNKYLQPKPIQKIKQMTYCYCTRARCILGLVLAISTAFCFFFFFRFIFICCCCCIVFFSRQFILLCHQRLL